MMPLRGPWEFRQGLKSLGPSKTLPRGPRKGPRRPSKRPRGSLVSPQSLKCPSGPSETQPRGTRRGPRRPSERSPDGLRLTLPRPNNSNLFEIRKLAVRTFSNYGALRKNWNFCLRRCFEEACLSL